MRIEWNKVDWQDVALHVVVAVVICCFFLGFGFLFGRWLIWLTAPAVIIFFWQHEARQRPKFTPNPLRWGWGAQMELYAPAAAAIVTQILGLVLPPG